MNSIPSVTEDHTTKNGQSDAVPLYRFWKPRYWALWVALGALRLMILLPFRLQISIGAGLGRLLFLVMPKRRRIAEANIRLCFPELDEAARRRLVRAHGASLGFSILEIGLTLWASQSRVESLVTFKGLDNLTAALADGNGVIVLSGHFPAGELIGRAAPGDIPPSAAMYRPLKNPLIDQLMRRARHRVFAALIPKDGVRKMIRLLRKGWPVWYASDQSYDRANAVLVPFFGEPAMTNPALTDIARMGRARVVPFFPHRLADGSGYECVVLPALENFPTDDPAVDAARVNDLLADFIREAPEQYYWVHRRFKNRPEPWPDPYRNC